VSTRLDTGSSRARTGEEPGSHRLGAEPNGRPRMKFDTEFGVAKSIS
jgi:hypothetical protein